MHSQPAHYSFRCKTSLFLLEHQDLLRLDHSAASLYSYDLLYLDCSDLMCSDLNRKAHVRTSKSVAPVRQATDEIFTTHHVIIPKPATPATIPRPRRVAVPKPNTIYDHSVYSIRGSVIVSTHQDRVWIMTLQSSICLCQCIEILHQ
jgi:sensor c-di-GMP phosphodiesterase-like protein